LETKLDSPNGLPFKVKWFNRTVEIVPEYQQQITWQIANNVVGVGEVELGKQCHRPTILGSGPWQIGWAIWETSNLGSESIFGLTNRVNENINRNGLSPLELIAHSSTKPFVVAEVAGARDVVTRIMAMQIR
jgi:hypothetical protein